MFVGAISIILALLGWSYNFVTLRADYSAPPHPIGEPYFYWALYTMSTVCIVCYALLFYIGVQMIRGKTDVVRLLTFLIVFEVLYFFAVGSLWLMPEYGRSIAAATGVSNGGMMFQLLVLFPIWAPILAFLASRSLREMSSAGR
jgi:hypothetical protein